VLPETCRPAPVPPLLLDAPAVLDALVLLVGPVLVGPVLLMEPPPEEPALLLPDDAALGPVPEAPDDALAALAVETPPVPVACSELWPASQAATTMAVESRAPRAETVLRRSGHGHERMSLPPPASCTEVAPLASVSSVGAPSNYGGICLRHTLVPPNVYHAPAAPRLRDASALCASKAARRERRPSETSRTPLAMAAENDAEWTPREPPGTTTRDEQESA
jgi:hypothetical protein